MRPELGSLYGTVQNARIIRPGVPDQSVLYRRMTTLEVFRMPSVGSHVVDEQGSELIRRWISELDACP